MVLTHQIWIPLILNDDLVLQVKEVVMGLELAKERIQSRKHAEEVPLS